MPSALTLDAELTFCQFSRKEIGAHVARYNHCLTTQSLSLPPPTGLKAATVSSFRIDLTWRDNSDNEKGFRVQRRLDDSADWVEIGKTNANATRFSDSGLSPGTYHRYRLQAFNDTESSFFSNEAAATTLGGSLAGTHWRIDTIAGRRVIDDGPAIAAQLHYPTGVAVDRAGNLYIADLQNNRIRRVDASGIITTVAGTGVRGYGGDNGPAIAAQLDFPVDVALDGAGNLYIADSRNNRVLVVTRSSLSTTLQPPGRLRAMAVSPFRVNLAWQDNSSNETGFIVRRRIARVADWVEIGNRLFIPIVLQSQGRKPGSFFTSELTLTNRGTTTAAIHYTYTAAFGGGSGRAVDSLEPGRQRIIPDAIAYLTSVGVPIGSGSAGGTLAVEFSNLSSESTAATVRVTTPVEEGSGRAGLAFPGLNPDGLLTGPAFITGLRQNSQDRSNLAVQNAGLSGEEAITLRVTVYSGDPQAPGSLVLPDLSLPPGGFHQYNGILTEAGFDYGYAKVERVEGTSPYYAYGIINDNFNSDGSFVFPVGVDSLEGKTGQTLPVIIETSDFASELTVTNFSPAPKTVDFRFVAEAVETDDDTAAFSLKLEAGEQRILPQVVDWMRRQGVAGIGRANRAYVGALFATVAEGDMSGVVMGARTGSPDARGGQYSLFYNGVINDGGKRGQRSEDGAYLLSQPQCPVSEVTVQWGGKKVYISGDTACIPEMKALTDPDTAEHQTPGD